MERESRPIGDQDPPLPAIPFPLLATAYRRRKLLQAMLTGSSTLKKMLADVRPSPPLALSSCQADRALKRRYIGDQGAEETFVGQERVVTSVLEAVQSVRAPLRSARQQTSAPYHLLVNINH